MSNVHYDVSWLDKLYRVEMRRNDETRNCLYVFAEWHGLIGMGEMAVRGQ